MILTVTTVLRAMWRVYPRWAVTYFRPPPFFKGGEGEDCGGQNSEGGSGYQNEEGGSS